MDRQNLMRRLAQSGLIAIRATLIWALPLFVFVLLLMWNEEFVPLWRQGNYEKIIFLVVGLIAVMVGIILFVKSAPYALNRLALLDLSQPFSKRLNAIARVMGPVLLMWGIGFALFGLAGYLFNIGSK